MIAGHVQNTSRSEPIQYSMQVEAQTDHSKLITIYKYEFSEVHLVLLNIQPQNEMMVSESDSLSLNQWSSS